MAGKSRKSAERVKCEFLLVRYVPELVKEEFVNIGVLLREKAEAGEPSGGPAQVRFTKDWSRARCMNPELDIASMESVTAELAQRLEDVNDGTTFLASLEDMLSNQFQLSRPRAYEAENLAAGMDMLARMYLERQKRETAAKRSARQSIYQTMRRTFAQAGLESFMQFRIPVTRYIAGADTLRIDCAYSNGGMKMFQAMPLENLDGAKVLAFTAPALAAGVLREAGINLELTAIAEPLIRKSDGSLKQNDDEHDLYQSGKRILEQAGINFLTTAALPRIAEGALKELGLN